MSGVRQSDLPQVSPRFTPSHSQSDRHKLLLVNKVCAAQARKDSPIGAAQGAERACTPCSHRSDTNLTKARALSEASGMGKVSA